MFLLYCQLADLGSRRLPNASLLHLSSAFRCMERQRHSNRRPRPPLCRGRRRNHPRNHSSKHFHNQPLNRFHRDLRLSWLIKSKGTCILPLMCSRQSLNSHQECARTSLRMIMRRLVSRKALRARGRNAKLRSPHLFTASNACVIACRSNNASRSCRQEHCGRD